MTGGGGGGGGGNEGGQGLSQLSHNEHVTWSLATLTSNSPAADTLDNGNKCGIRAAAVTRASTMNELLREKNLFGNPAILGL